MTVPGTYAIEKISKDAFCSALMSVPTDEAIDSYIGTKCRQLIKKWTGLTLKACNKDIAFEDTEGILIMEMNFKAKVKDNALFIPEFIFYEVQYTKEILS